MLINADLVDGRALESLIALLFADPRAAYLHVHFAKPGLLRGANRAGVIGQLRVISCQRTRVSRP